MGTQYSLDTLYFAALHKGLSAGVFCQHFPWSPVCYRTSIRTCRTLAEAIPAPYDFSVSIILWFANGLSCRCKCETEKKAVFLSVHLNVQDQIKLHRGRLQET
jgi:hypothetical protein